MNTDLLAALTTVSSAPGRQVFMRAGKLECAGVVQSVSFTDVTVACNEGQTVSVGLESLDELTLR